MSANRRTLMNANRGTLTHMNRKRFLYWPTLAFIRTIIR